MQAEGNGRTSKKRERGGLTLPPPTSAGDGEGAAAAAGDGETAGVSDISAVDTGNGDNHDVAALRAACANRRQGWLSGYSSGPEVQRAAVRVLHDDDSGSVEQTFAGSCEVPDADGDSDDLAQQLCSEREGAMPRSATPTTRTNRSGDGITQIFSLDSGLSTHRVSDEYNDYTPGADNAETPAEVSMDTRSTRAGNLACATDCIDLEYDGVTGDCDPDPRGSRLSLNSIDMFTVRDNNRCFRAIFDVVACTGQFNFRAARIPLPSALRISRWRSALRGYKDQHIVEYLEYGWPIGINRDAALRSHMGNHPSARAHQADVEHYVATELSHRALLGPFDGPPTNRCHVSPLMTRPKKGSQFRRVIVDLSWPKGYSINDGISRVEYIDGPMTISLPTHDEMERAVVRAGRGSFLYKTDLSRGYRQLRVDPLDWPYLSFQHKSKFYMDICPPFGLRSSAMAMQRVSQAIVHLHARRGYLSRAYIDDFGGVEPAEARAGAALSALQAIMDDLGVAQAESKICLPAQVMVWLGIQFDTREMSMTIPEEKLREIMACLRSWMGRLRASRKDIQSLLGLLNFVASVAPPVRLFTNRMLDTLRETPSTGSSSLSCQFKQDVLFFAELLPIFNGRKIMGKSVVPYQHQVELDAYLTGCGAVAGEQFYATPFPESVIRADHTIAHLELLNIVVAIKMWRVRWAGWTVQVFCDNLNSVHVLQSGRSRDHFMRACAREVFLHTAANDIDIQVCHRPGLAMVWADALSREHTGERHAARVRDDPHLRRSTRLVVPAEFFRIDNVL